MGSRGPKPKEKPAWRPQLRLAEGALRRARQLGVEELSALIEWALPLWPGMDHTPATPGAALPVVLRPAGARNLRPVQVWLDARRGVCANLGSRDEAFRELMRAQGLAWEEAVLAYVLPLDERTGSPVDRTCELAAGLYRAGWAVEVPSQDLAGRMIGGQYQLRQRRWVGTQDRDFLLSWEHGGDRVWTATQNLPGARWDKQQQGAVVSWRAVDDLLDFAREHGFAFTAAAQARLVEARLEIARELVGVELAPGQRPPLAQPPAPGSSGEVVIPDDLLADHD